MLTLITLYNELLKGIKKWKSKEKQIKKTKETIKKNQKTKEFILFYMNFKYQSPSRLQNTIHPIIKFSE